MSIRKFINEMAEGYASIARLPVLLQLPENYAPMRAAQPLPKPPEPKPPKAWPPQGWTLGQAMVLEEHSGEID